MLRRIGQGALVVVLVSSALFLAARWERRVCLGGACVKVEVVRTSASRQKGLMGRASLPADRGMLFVFEKDDRWGIWMKNMSIPLDVIWLDRDRKVVDMVEDMKPFDPPPGSPAQAPVFQSVVPSRYVLEVNAGFARGRGIKVGDQASFDWIFKDCWL
jgi:hypothetical protein